MRRRSLEKFILFTAPFLACLHLYTQWAGSIGTVSNDKKYVDVNRGIGLLNNEIAASRSGTSNSIFKHSWKNVTKIQTDKKEQQVKNKNDDERADDSVQVSKAQNMNVSSKNMVDLSDPLNSFIEKHHTGPKLQFGSNFHVNHSQALLAGKLLEKKVFLAFGIPTVKRDGGIVYVKDTLTSLINHTPDAEKKNVVFVVFLADFDKTFRTEILAQITAAFPSELDNGLIQVIEAPTDAYPPLTNLPKKYNDATDRIFWRSKQNVDYAFLMLYCKDLSQYYMQIEDDVATAKNYMVDIRRHLSLNAKKMWVYLRFSTLGFIGIFLRTSDLESLGNFLLLLYTEMPCDWLIVKWQNIKGQSKDIVCKPTLFQHRGFVSSLKGQRRKMIDKSFKDKAGPLKLHRGRSNNPSAVYTTNMTVVNRHPISNAYEDLNPTTMFWAEAVKAGQFIEIKLKQPFNASYLHIVTGKKEGSKDDRLQDGTIKISSGTEGTGCDKLVAIGGFFEGVFDTRSQKISLPNNLSCIYIEVDKSQKQWVAIRNIIIGHTESKSR